MRAVKLQQIEACHLAAPSGATVLIKQNLQLIVIKALREGAAWIGEG
jgi:hypothetical protein